MNVDFVLAYNSLYQLLGWGKVSRVPQPGWDPSSVLEQSDPPLWPWRGGSQGLTGVWHSIKRGWQKSALAFKNELLFLSEQLSQPGRVLFHEGERYSLACSHPPLENLCVFSQLKPGFLWAGKTKANPEIPTTLQVNYFYLVVWWCKFLAI